MFNRWLSIKGEVPLNEEKSPLPADGFQHHLLHFQQVAHLPFLSQLYIKRWELNSTFFFFLNLRYHPMKSPESCKSVNIFVIVLSNFTISQLCFTALVEQCCIDAIERSCAVRVFFPVLIIILFYNLQKYFIRLFVLQLFVLWSMSVDNSAFF